MLGDMLGEEHGSVTAFRIVPEGLGVKVESQFQGSGTLLGTEVTDLATYWSVPRPDGNFTGGATGLVLTADADAATYTGQGVGQLLGRGGASRWRGALFYMAASPKFAPLNSIAVLFEFEIDETSRNMDIKLWEWK